MAANVYVQVNGLDAVVGTSGRIGLMQAFRQVIQREGVMALWKGNGVTIVHRLPYSAVNFWAYERATQMWLQHYPQPAGAQQVPRTLHPHSYACGTPKAVRRSASCWTWIH